MSFFILSRKIKAFLTRAFNRSLRETITLLGALDARANVHAVSRKLTAEKIRDSGLFDAAFYCSQFPLLFRPFVSMNPIRHYLCCSLGRRKSPNPLFDFKFYLETQPHLLDGGEEPLLHFYRAAGEQKLSPHPLFNTRYYLANLSEPLDISCNPLLHFLQTSNEELNDPHPWFKVDYYLGQCAGVAEFKENPLLHYLRSPQSELKDPCPQFSSGGYLETFQDVKNARMNPLYHFFRWGRQEKRTVVSVGEAVQKSKQLVVLIATDVSRTRRIHTLYDTLSRHHHVVLLHKKTGLEVSVEPTLHPLAVEFVLPEELNGKGYQGITRRMNCNVLVLSEPDVQVAWLARGIEEHCGCSLFVDSCDLTEKPDVREILAKIPREFISNNPKRLDALFVPDSLDERCVMEDLVERRCLRRQIGVREDQLLLYARLSGEDDQTLVTQAQACLDFFSESWMVLFVVRLSETYAPQLYGLMGGMRRVHVRFDEGRCPIEAITAADAVYVEKSTGHGPCLEQLAALALGLPVVAGESAATGIFSDARIMELGARKRRGGGSSGKLGASERRGFYLDNYSYLATADILAKFLSAQVNDGCKQPVFERNKDSRLHGNTTKVSDGVPEEHTEGLDFVLFWKQNDTGLYGRRPDMLAKYLCRHPDVGKVLIIDAPISREMLMTLPETRGDVEHQYVFRETIARHFGLRDTRPLSYGTYIYKENKLQSHERSLNKGYIAHLQKIFRQVGISPNTAIFWTFPVNYTAEEVVRSLKPAFHICDVVDDNRIGSHILSREYRKRSANYAWLLKNADMRITNAQSLQKSMKSYAGPLHLVPNAIDTDPIEPLPLKHRLYGLRGPIIGYVGNLESKIDLGLLEKLAERYPTWNVVLIGSTHSNPAVKRLERWNNIHFMGVVAYDELRHLVACFDVAIAPHKENTLTRSMNPLKLYVYLAARVPIVAIGVSNVDQLKQYVTITNSHSEFMKAVEAFCENSAADEKVKNHEFQYADTWTCRVDDMVANVIERIAQS